MPIPLIAAAIGAIGAGISAGVGAANAAAAQGASAAEQERVRKMFDAIPLPDLQKMVAEQLGPSAVEGVSADPRLKDAQMGFFNQMQDMASKGFTAQDEAALNESGNTVARQNRNARDNIFNQMANRGALGSGADYAMQAQAAQDAAQGANTGGLNAQSQMLNRRFNAMLQGGNMGSQMRSQDFDERSRAAAAKDHIAQWNAQARQGAQNYNLGLSQQNFNNQMSKAAGASGQAAQFAQSQNQAAQQAMAQGSGIGQSIAGLGSSVAGYLSDKDKFDQEQALRKQALSQGVTPYGNGYK